MDITMPVLDGIGAVKRIISFDPEAQIVMISALDQKFMVLTAIQNGARHYIIKPFSAEKVIHVIDDVLNSIKGKSVKKEDKLPDKQQESPSSLNTTITDINESINNINDAIKTLDEEPERDK
jgi:YesN/AraC family two-component response regulator